MALRLYRRHRKECEGSHREGSFTGEFEEGRRGWKKCGCLIHASGTLGRKFNRKQNGKSDWDEAKAVAAVWEEADSWDGKAKPEPAPPLKPATQEAGKSTPARVTIVEATKVFLANREGAKIAAARLRKYRTFTTQLTALADSRGYVMLDQFTSADIDVFYSTWKLGARAKGKALSRLRSFFRFCAKRKWVVVDPSDPKSVGPVSSDLKPPVGANRVANKIPYTDEEVQRIINACDRLPNITWSSGMGKGTWTGEDVKDFIWMMVYTGLRISDVGLFHMNRLKGNEVFLRAKKNGGDVFAYIPDWLRDRLNARAKRYGARPFIVGRSYRLETVTDLWRRQIGKVFELAEQFDERP